MLTHAARAIDGRRTSRILWNALLEEQVRRARSVDGRLSTYNARDCYAAEFSAALVAARARRALVRVNRVRRALVKVISVPWAVRGCAIYRAARLLSTFPSDRGGGGRGKTTKPGVPRQCAAVGPIKYKCNVLMLDKTTVGCLSNLLSARSLLSHREHQRCCTRWAMRAW